MNFVWIFCICSVCFYIVISIIAKIVNKIRAKKFAKEIILAEATKEQETTETEKEE